MVGTRAGPTRSRRRSDAAVAVCACNCNCARVARQGNKPPPAVRSRWRLTPPDAAAGCGGELAIGMAGWLLANCKRLAATAPLAEMLKTLGALTVARNCGEVDGGDSRLPVVAVVVVVAAACAALPIYRAAVLSSGAVGGALAAAGRTTPTRCALSVCAATPAGEQGPPMPLAPEDEERAGNAEDEGVQGNAAAADTAEAVGGSAEGSKAASGADPTMDAVVGAFDWSRCERSNCG